MNTVTLNEAQQHLPELVRKLTRDGELLITDADQPVARLSVVTPRPSLRNLEPRSVGAVGLVRPTRFTRLVPTVGGLTWTWRS